MPCSKRVACRSRGVRALAGLWMLAALAGPAAAVSFPALYTGGYRLTVTVSNERGSGLCTDTAALSITLYADGQLRWEIAELEARLEAPDDRPPSCSIRLTGRTHTLLGTHDRFGRYSVPSGSPSLPPITGRYDDENLTGEYRVGPSYIDFDLPAVSHRVAIEPDPGVGFEFHRSILEGRGFKVVMRDPHGRDHLDFSTLRVLVGGSATVPGNDITAYFLGRLQQGVVPYTEESGNSLTRAFRIRPDPQKLMQGHDVFSIPYNGEWRIELRLCDKAGSCFGTVYEKVWFGPFVALPDQSHVGDLRCTAPLDRVLRLTSVVLGNIGIDSPKTAIYAGLIDASTGSLWTFFFDDFGDGTARHAWWQGRVLPLLPEMSMPSGLLTTIPELGLVDGVAVPAGPGTPASRRDEFPAGRFRFATAALDVITGVYRLDQHDVQMCGP